MEPHLDDAEKHVRYVDVTFLVASMEPHLDDAEKLLFCVQLNYQSDASMEPHLDDAEKLGVPASLRSHGGFNGAAP